MPILKYFDIDIIRWNRTFVPLLGPMGGGGGGLGGGAALSLGGGGGGMAASWALTTSLLEWEEFLEKKMETREEVVVLVGMLEVSTKLEAAEAMLEVAMAFAFSLSLSLALLSLASSFSVLLMLFFFCLQILIRTSGSKSRLKNCRQKF